MRSLAFKSKSPSFQVGYHSRQANMVTGLTLTVPSVQYAQTNAHWIVPRHPNPLFTGREDLLRELEVTIREAVNSPMNRAQCRIVISGIGGQGKSEICLQLTRRLRQM